MKSYLQQISTICNFAVYHNWSLNVSIFHMISQKYNKPNAFMHIFCETRCF